MMLLHATHDLLLHLLLYCQSLRRQHVVKGTVLSKPKLPLFPTLPLISFFFFKMMRLIHLRAVFHMHLIILIHSPIQSEHARKVLWTQSILYCVGRYVQRFI